MVLMLRWSSTTRILAIPPGVSVARCGMTTTLVGRLHVVRPQRPHVPEACSPNASSRMGRALQRGHLATSRYTTKRTPGAFIKAIIGTWTNGERKRTFLATGAPVTSDTASRAITAADIDHVATSCRRRARR